MILQILFNLWHTSLSEDSQFSKLDPSIKKKKTINPGSFHSGPCHVYIDFFFLSNKPRGVDTRQHRLTGNSFFGDFEPVNFSTTLNWG